MMALHPNLHLLPLFISLLLLLSSSSLLHINHHHHVSAFTTTTCGHYYSHSRQSSSLSAHDHSNSQIDWAQYSLHQSYKKAGGILYKQSLLTPAEFAAVQMAINEIDLNLTDESESSFATNRIGAVIDRHSDVYDILSCSDGTLCRLVNGLADSDDDDGIDEKLGKMILSPDIPIEIRIYEKSGAGMNWHVDDIIYIDTKQIEVVFTLENTSDCSTMWKPHDQPILASNPTQDHDLASGGSDASDQYGENRYRVESVQTTPNSAIIIKAGSVEHKVSPLTYGRRVILKMAFVREGASMSDEMRSHVTHHNGSIAGKSKRMNKKKAASRSRSRSQGDNSNSRKKNRQRR